MQAPVNEIAGNRLDFIPCRLQICRMRVSLRPRSSAANQSEAYDGDKRDRYDLARAEAIIVERLVVIAVVARHPHSTEEEAQAEHQLDPFTRVAPGIQIVNKKSTGKRGYPGDRG